MTLQFSRQPFLSQTTSVMVPWNQVITMGTVLMVLSDNDLIPPNPAFCGVVHEHYTLQPVVLSTWQHTQLGSCPEKSTIIPESQVLIDSSNNGTCIVFIRAYFRVPTSSGIHGKPGKSQKNSMHGKIMEFEKKTLYNHGKIMEFCEII